MNQPHAAAFIRQHKDRHFCAKHHLGVRIRLLNVWKLVQLLSDGQLVYVRSVAAASVDRNMLICCRNILNQALHYKRLSSYYPLR